MKKILSVLVVFLLIISSIEAQRIVKVAPFPAVDELAKVIKADSNGRRSTTQKTIYELERNGYYPVVQAIENKDFFLHIRAEAGTGPLPLIQASPTTGTTYTFQINFRSNGKLENLIFDGNRPTGLNQNRYINVYNGSSLWITGCEIMHDRGAMVAIQSNDCSIYVEDCFIHSIGHPKSLGGNGRVIDLRTITTHDSVVVRNCTFFNLSDRIMRSNGTITNYVEFDHNTCFVTSGYHGGLQSGKAKELKVTNNILRNVIVWGAHRNRVKPLGKAVEQLQPENNNMYVVSIDTSKLIVPKITVRNNNIYWEKKYTDIWAKYKDSTKAPGIYTATINRAIGADSAKAFMVEELKFTKEPDDIVAFTDAGLGTPNSLTLPENWWNVYQDPKDTKSINGAYPTTSKSYTAGDKGLPLGDLNWFPDKKKIFTGIEKFESGTIPTSIELSQNYPNPFNPVTNINYTITKQMKVSLSIFDVLGREVATLVNQVQEPGRYNVDFDASKLSSGVYIYQLLTPNTVVSKKMMLLK